VRAPNAAEVGYRGGWKTRAKRTQRRECPFAAGG
jgi:hypothetical protein